MSETRIVNLYSALDAHGAHRNSQGEVGAGMLSNCMTISTAGASPIVPERWPRLPPTSRQFWSPPKERSPGPISTRVPSIDSTNHRPERGMIHCGLGFSCHVPTQPMGCTVTIVVIAPLIFLLCH